MLHLEARCVAPNPSPTSDRNISHSYDTLLTLCCQNCYSPLFDQCTPVLLVLLRHRIPHTHTIYTDKNVHTSNMCYMLYFLCVSTKIAVFLLKLKEHKAIADMCLLHTIIWGNIRCKHVKTALLYSNGDALSL